jgi:hypothetical protein
LGFSLTFIYEKSSILQTSVLSILLFNIYFHEFDNLLLYLCFRFTSFKTLFYLPCINVDKAVSSFLSLNYYLPLRLENIIQSSINLRTLRSSNIKLNKIIHSHFSSSLLSVFTKNFFASRYKNHLLLGLVASKRFLFFLESKLISFLRSVLLFDIKNYVMSDTKIYFLGFEISCLPFNQGSDYNVRFLKLHRINNFKTKVLTRISFFKMNYLKLFLRRIRYELTTNFFRKIEANGVFFNNKLEYKFWSYFFQLESSRCFRYYVVIFADDFSNRCSN